jgi:hypothetical protein
VVEFLKRYSSMKQRSMFSLLYQYSSFLNGGSQKYSFKPALENLKARAAVVIVKVTEVKNPPQKNNEL